MEKFDSAHGLRGSNYVITRSEEERGSVPRRIGMQDNSDKQGQLSPAFFLDRLRDIAESEYGFLIDRHKDFQWHLDYGQTETLTRLTPVGDCLSKTTDAGMAGPIGVSGAMTIGGGFFVGSLPRLAIAVMQKTVPRWQCVE